MDGRIQKGRGEIEARGGIGSECPLVLLLGSALTNVDVNNKIMNTLRATMLGASRIFFLALLSLIFMASTGAGNGEPEKIDYKLDEENLLSGGIQIFEKEYEVEGQGRKKRVVGVQIINAPPEKVWEAIADWEGQADFVPGLEYNKSIHVFDDLDGKDETWNTLYEEQIKVLYLTITFTLDVNFDKANNRISWEFVTDEQVEKYKGQKIPVEKATSGLRNIEGFEYLEPYGDGSQTIHYYAPIVEVSIPLPEFLERILSKNTLNGYMEGIREMVDSLDKSR